MVSITLSTSVVAISCNLARVIALRRSKRTYAKLSEIRPGGKHGDVSSIELPEVNILLAYYDAHWNILVVCLQKLLVELSALLD